MSNIWNECSIYISYTWAMYLQFTGNIDKAILFYNIILMVPKIY